MATKFGIVAPLPGVPVKDLINFAKKSEDSGLDSVWYPDHILFMAKKLTPEVWSVITGASVITDKIQLGAIGDPHRMHPATMAHRLATVDHISDGRVFSCLGYGESGLLRH
jgi:alkanesulfonate monooxygenase SsuD/methylene tetrahydromethanopterin reductase-like flavin-dependent oxidoreductase (luciferase family)